MKATSFAERLICELLSAPIEHQAVSGINHCPHHIKVMTDDKKHTEMLEAACVDLGVAFETLPRGIREPISAETPSQRGSEMALELSDSEWALLAPLLPPEPPQAETLENRQVLNNVIWVVAKAKGWTDLGEPHEAIRRRFGRWAHAGVWQRLFEGVAHSELSSERLRQLQRISERAERQRKKRLA
jgi:transposase